jgi:hypothetical protein
MIGEELGSNQYSILKVGIKIAIIVQIGNNVQILSNQVNSPIS